MCSCFPTLNLLMQFPDIMRNCQQNTLRFYIRFPSIPKSSETCILFQISKTSLGLDTPVHSQQNPFFASDPLQVILSVLVELPGNIQIFRPVFEWNFTVVPFDTFFFVWASAAVCTAVNSRFPFVSCFGFFFLYLTDFQSFSVVAGVGVLLRIIFHIFCSADVVLIRTLFPNLIISRLDKCLFLFFLQISVILFALISSIRCYSFVFEVIYIFFRIFEKRDQRCGVRRLRPYC